MAAKSDDHSLPPGFGTRPWLVQGSRGDTLTFVDVSDLSLHETVVPEVRGKTCLGGMHGDWLLMLHESTADCFLLRISTNPRTKIQLPPLHQPLNFLSTIKMLESPDSPKCTMPAHRRWKKRATFYTAAPVKTSGPNWFPRSMTSISLLLCATTKERSVLLVLIS
jgi:hypothetical protein